MAFFAKVSDPAVGGTYMTLLNTLCNLGGNWPATAALWFVDSLTFRQCSSDPSNDCSTITEREVCKHYIVPETGDRKHSFGDRASKYRRPLVT